MGTAGVTDSGGANVLDLGVDGLVVVDDQGVVRFANQTARSLLGSLSIGDSLDLPRHGEEMLLRLPGTGKESRAVAVRTWPGILDCGAATLATIRGVGYQMLEDSTQPPEVHPGAGDTPAPVESPLKQPPGGARCVLVVEDQMRIRRLVTRILDSEGFRVLEAEDADAALALLEAHGDEVDLLLTDIVMPGLSGPELASKVHDVRPELHVLFMSGYTNGYLSDAGDDVGTAVPTERFLQKPFSVEQLLDRIDKVLGTPGSAGADGVEE